MGETPLATDVNSELPQNARARPADRGLSSGLGRRLLYGGMWVVIGRWLELPPRSSSTLYWPRLLNPTDFSAFGLLISIVTTASIVAMGGFNIGAVRFLSESLSAGDRDRTRRVLHLTSKIVLVTTLALSVTVLISLALGHGKILELQNPGLVCILAALAVALLSWNNMAAAILRGFDEPRLAIFLGPQHSGGPIGATMFLTLLLTVGWQWVRSLDAAMTLYVVAYTACLPVAAVWVSKTIRKSFRTTAWQEQPARFPQFTPRLAVSTGLSVMMTQVLTIATRESDLWIAGTFGASDDLGLYVAARRIAQILAMPLWFVNLSVIAVIPALWSQGRTRELQTILQTAATIAGAVAAVFLVVILAAPGLALEGLFGEYYRNAAAPLVILCLGQFVFTWIGSCEMVLLMTGHERWALSVNVLSASLIMSAGPFVVSRSGILGLAVLSSIVIAGQNAVQWIVVRRYLGMSTHAAPFRARPVDQES